MKKRDRNLFVIVVGVAAIAIGYWVGWDVEEKGHYFSVAGGVLVLGALAVWAWPFSKNN